MIVPVALHEVLYSAHTDGFERKKKTLVSTSSAKID